MDVRRIDFAEAELFIHAAGDWRGFRSGACAKEPETADWIGRVARPGSVFFDIGACVGSYSLIAAALGATVHAFEPAAPNYAELQLNTWLNGTLSITGWPVACAAETGPVRIDLSSPRSGAASHSVHSFARPGPGNGRVSQGAIGITLDRFTRDFGLPQPNDLKIDVDGGETGVLAGARETLRNVRSVMVEVGPDTETAVAAILLAVGLEHAGSWPRSGRQSNQLFERPA